MFKRPLCEMASGLILGSFCFRGIKKWYLAAVAAGILFGIVWNLWHNTIRNCIEKDSMANARAWIYPAFRVGCFLAFFLAGIFHFAEIEAFRQNLYVKTTGWNAGDIPMTDGFGTGRYMMLLEGPLEGCGNARLLS